jgi:hypothetical protein
MEKGLPGCGSPNLFSRLWKPRPIVVLRVVDRGLVQWGPLKHPSQLSRPYDRVASVIAGLRRRCRRAASLRLVNGPRQQ